MTKNRVLAALIALVLMLTASIDQALSKSPVRYQSEQWSEPSVLTTEATSPIVVADSAGDLHIFFAGKTADNDEQAARTIFYMSQSGDQWAPPLDILFSPGNAVSLNGAAVDAAGNLHLSWNDGRGTYHSRVHADLAGNASNWETELVSSGRLPTGEMVQDEDGRLHMALVSDLASVAYLYSDDGGRSWTPPLPVDRVFYTENLAIGGAQMAVDQTGGLHVTWYQTAQEVGWNLWSVWYARSTDEGNSWQVTEMAAPLYGESDIAVDGENNVHLVYGRNIRYSDGRWHQWSEDVGATWSAARPLFGTVEHASGSTGGYGFALDGDGRLHLANTYGNGNGDASAWHLIWQGDRWSTPTQLMDTRYHAHFPRLAVTDGNQLNFFATSARMANMGVFESHSMTDSSLVEARPLPTLVPEAGVQEAPAIEEINEAPMPDKPRVELSDEARMAPPTKARFDSLMIAVGAAALVILMAILIVRRFSEGRRLHR